MQDQRRKDRLFDLNYSNIEIQENENKYSKSWAIDDQRSVTQDQSKQKDKLLRVNQKSNIKKQMNYQNTHFPQSDLTDQMKNFCIYTTIILTLIVILYIWESSTRQWRQLRNQEVMDLKCQLENYKSKQLQCQYKIMKFDIQDDNSDSLYQDSHQVRYFKSNSTKVKQNIYKMRIYLPCQGKQDIEVKLRGVIFFIYGLCGKAANWEYVLSKLANLGYIVICQEFEHTYDLQKDVLTMQTLWNRVFNRLVQKRVELLHQQRVIIGHSYGGLVAQILGQYSEQFTKIVLFSPLLGLDIKLTVLPLEVLQTLRRQNKLDIKLNNISLKSIWSTLNHTKQICTDQTCYDFDIHLIISTHENLISNKKVLEFYENINTTRKELIVSKHITHYSQSDNILEIFTKILK